VDGQAQRWGVKLWQAGPFLGVTKLNCEMAANVQKISGLGESFGCLYESKDELLAVDRASEIVMNLGGRKPLAARSADGIGTLLYAVDRALYAMKSLSSRPFLAARQSG
jgi:hypothetical protein